MHVIALSTASIASKAADDFDLRAGVEEICAQLCAVVAGDFGSRIETASEDVAAQKLAMLTNTVLAVARGAIDEAEAKASALSDAHRIARLGTWRRDFRNGTLSVSEDLDRLLGIDSFSAEKLLAMVHPEDRAGLQAGLARAASGQPGESEFRLLRPDGTIAWFWAQTRAETDAEGKVVAIRGVTQDITEHHATAQRLYELAHYDPLTGLANRTLLHERLSAALARAARDDSAVAVLCLDLDGFKAVNDLHGHSAGDRLLREVAARLTRNVRETDIVARLGGDEFVVVQDAVAHPQVACSLADRLVAALAEPYDLGAETPRGAVTTSVGIALFPSDGGDPDMLLRNADTALYRAKSMGKNGAALFRPEMDHELRAQRALERDLRQAAARPEAELALEWQPLSAAEDCQVVGFEALLRWHHPERGPVPPAQFIPAAEACGAIASIGAWVLRTACREAARWANPLRIAVNVSPLQAQQGDTFAEMVEQALAASGLAPSRLVLEVTESVLIREGEKVLAALRRLKAPGVQVALDDFGTGYSSLATLRAFPFDKIKIDRSFVAGIIDPDGQDAAIVRAVLGLARGLGLPVVAEGVETEEQLKALRQAGCHEVQGWLLGRPAPIEAFASLIGRTAEAISPLQSCSSNKALMLADEAIR